MAVNKIRTIPAFRDDNEVIASHSFKWTIKEFSSQTARVMESPSFFVGVNELAEWKIKAYPDGNTNTNKGYLGLFLKLESSYECQEAKYIFYILNAKKIEVDIKGNNSIDTFISQQSQGGGQYITRDMLLNKINGYLTDDDTLTIVCDINVFGSNKDKASKICLPGQLQHIFFSNKFSDVTLVVGNEKFQAHKAILAARSPVFSAMFDHDMKENQQNQIDIIDIDAKVLKEMLNYIYTGKAQNMLGMAEDLLVAADKYQLERLKLVCEQALCNKLHIYNAVKFLILADRHSINQLKKIAIDFICKHAKDVSKTEHFELMEKDLMIEVFKAFAEVAQIEQE